MLLSEPEKPRERGESEQAWVRLLEVEEAPAAARQLEPVERELLGLTEERQGQRRPARLVARVEQPMQALQLEPPTAAVRVQQVAEPQPEEQLVALVQERQRPATAPLAAVAGRHHSRQTWST